MPARRIRTRRSSPSRSRWRQGRRHELGDHTGAPLARGRSPQAGRGTGVSHARVGKVEHQRPHAGRLLPARFAGIPHPAAVHGDGHAGRVRRPRHRGGGRANGPGGRVAARHRAGAVPRGRAAPQEAPVAGPVDAGSPRGRAQEAGARRSAQAVPVLEEIETSSHTLPDPMPGPYGVAPEMTAAADRTPERKGMAQPQLQDLLEAGVHFGHQTRRWNPKMRRFIFAERSGIYIIDLQKTLHQLQKAQELLRSVMLRNEGVMFVCTKKQLKGIIQAEAQRCGGFFVTERWLGGTLTNFQTIKRQIKRLRELEQGLSDGEYQHHTKKEQLMFDRERLKLEKYLSGIKNMNRLPGALFVVDAKKERIAIAEANKLGIAVVAIVDTNADPDLITVPVTGNDDAIRSVSLITAALSDVIKEARAQMPMREVSEDLDAETYSTDAGSEGDSEADRKRRRPRRKRRPKPEAIAARLKTDT